MYEETRQNLGLALFVDERFSLVFAAIFFAAYRPIVRASGTCAGRGGLS